MAINNKTEIIYKNIMDRLISEIKDDFISVGCNEETLKELKNVRIYILIIY